jgi:glycosyltransferase involved in cell wall biosynthesis
LRLLFCTVLAPTKANGATIYTARVLRALCNLGLQITVFVIEFGNADPSRATIHWIPALQALRREGVIFRSFPAKPRPWLFIRAFVRLTRMVLREVRECDIFAFRLAYFQPIAVLVKTMRRTVATWWFHDGIVEEVYHVHPDPKHRLLAQGFGLLEKCGSRFVDWEFPVSERMRAYSVKKGIVGKRGSIVLPCVVELDRFRRRPPRVTGDGTVVVGYAGSMASWQDFEGSCRFLESLNKGLAIRLHVLTSQTDAARAIAAMYHLPARVESVPHEDVSVQMDLWDFALVPQHAGPITKVCSPLKAAEALSKGVPLIICPDVGDFSYLVREYGVGVVFDPDDDRTWQGAAEILARLLDTYDEVSARCRRLAEERYGCDTVEARLREVLNAAPTRRPAWRSRDGRL